MGLIITVGVGVVAFVAGVLVGRKNKKGVEKLYAQAKAEIDALKAKVGA
jgi:hypothetical protein